MISKIIFKKKQKGLIGLSKLNNKEKNELFNTIDILSENTKKKYKLFKNQFLEFINRDELRKEDCTEENAYAFIRYSGEIAGYCISTIKGFIGPCIKYMYKKVLERDLDENMKLTITRALRQMNRSNNVKKETDGKEPLLYTDVNKIIKELPDWLYSKYFEASLYLFAVQTGARSITCSKVRLKDLNELLYDKNENTYYIKINLDRTKGVEKGWGHIVTLKGDLESKNEDNFIRWLNMHLEYTFGLDIRKRKEWRNEEDGLERYVWNMNPKTMEHLLLRRIKVIGYDEKEFGFHSFRSGFLCSAIIKAGSDMDKRRGALEETAIIAGWKLNGKTQHRYMKKALSTSICCTNLTRPREKIIDIEKSKRSTRNSNKDEGNKNKKNYTEYEEEVISKFLTLPQIFHNMKNEKGNFDNLLKYSLNEVLKNRLNKRLITVSKYYNEIENKYIIQNLYKDIIKDFILKDHNKKGDRNNEYVQKYNKYFRKYRSNIISYKIRKFLKESLDKDKKNIIELCDDMINYYFSKKKISDYYDEVVKSDKFREYKERREKKEVVGVRRLWTEEELDKFEKLFMEYGDEWKLIEKGMKTRSNVQIKDKWRNLDKEIKDKLIKERNERLRKEKEKEKEKDNDNDNDDINYEDNKEGGKGGDNIINEYTQTRYIRFRLNIIIIFIIYY